MRKRGGASQGNPKNLRSVFEKDTSFNREGEGKEELYNHAFNVCMVCKRKRRAEKGPGQARTIKKKGR